VCGPVPGPFRGTPHPLRFQESQTDVQLGEGTRLEWSGKVKMELNRVQEIERAIGGLTQQELAELYSWLDQNCPQPIDSRVQSDLAAGHLDEAIQRALEDEKNGRVQPL